MKSFVLESIKKIQDAIGNNKLAIFVGTGVSANSGLPVWDELIDEFSLSVGKKRPPYSVDDYLKIPQYYFNERGFKEYYEVIRTKFNIKAHPNSLHNLVFNLNPAHIITTNFDDLLEQTIVDKGYSYDVVKQDRDLPYTPNNKIIIKMHGDLELKNIVLKENDYLSYSNNFRLIENFVKSLFASYTVLFVGYSVNDPDVKLLFQWVKDILKEDFQNAYLLNTDKKIEDIDRVEFNYYHNRGINILYFDSIRDQSNPVIINNAELQDLEERGKQLYKFLHFIQNYNRDMDKTSIQNVYDKLIILDELNRILAKDVLKVLGVRGQYSVEESILRIEPSVTERLVDDFEKIGYHTANLQKNEQKMLQKIKKILKKANIKAIIFGNDQKKFDVFKDKLIKVDDIITMYNYRQFGKVPLIEENQKDIELFKNAFYFYKLGKYFESYKVLKKISAKSYRDRNYLFYFLSEFNRINIANLVLFNGRLFGCEGINEREYLDIKLEMSNIDLEEVYSMMPIKVRKKYFFLKDLLNFKLIYQYFNKAVTHQPEIENEKNVVRVGSHRNIPIYKLHELAIELWEYINCNYLTIEHLNEVKQFYQSYVESVIISYTTPEKDNKDNIEDNSFFSFVSDAKVCKLEQISYCTIFIMINSMKSAELEILFEKYDVEEIKLQSGDMVKLLQTFTNIIATIKELDALEYYRFANNMFIIFGRIDIGANEFCHILKEIKNLLLTKGLEYDTYNFMKKFLVHQNKKFNHNVVVQSIMEFMQEYLYKVFLLKNSSWDYEATNTLKILDVFSYIICKKGEKIYLPSAIANIVLESIDKISVSAKKSNDINNFLLPLYKIIEEPKRKLVENIIYLQLKEDFCPHLYYKACIQNIITADMDLESRFIEKVDNALSIYDEDKRKGKMSYPNREDTFMAYLVNLIFLNKYKDKNKYARFIGRKPIFDFFFSPRKFNYNKFDVAWLLELPHSMLVMLANISNARCCIRNVLKDKIMDDSAGKELKKIYFCYFSNTFQKQNRRKINVINRINHSYLKKTVIVKTKKRCSNV